MSIRNNRDDGIIFLAGDGFNPRNNFIVNNYIYSNGRNGITIAAWQDQNRSGNMNNVIAECRCFPQWNLVSATLTTRIHRRDIRRTGG